jgi:hypothetical protein
MLASSTMEKTLPSLTRTSQHPLFAFVRTLKREICNIERKGGE